MLAHQLVEGQAGHLGYHYASGALVQRDDREKMVAIDQVTLVIYSQETVTIAVEGKAQVTALLDDCLGKLA